MSENLRSWFGERAWPSPQEKVRKEFRIGTTTIFCGWKGYPAS